MRPLAVLGIVLGLVAVAAPARAIPPFARRYGMSCGACHVGGPFKLSEFGEVFRDNGYRIPGDDAAYLREPPVPLGDPSRAALFPRAVWPGELPSQVPLGLAGLARATGTLPQAGPAQLQLAATALLLFGGSLGEHITAFGALAGGTAGLSLGQLFAVGRSLFDGVLPEAALNVKIGRLTPDIFPIQPQLGRGLSAPLPVTLQVRAGGASLAGSSEGIELWGLVGGRVKWVAGVVNGNKPLDDTETRRDLFARVAVKLGGERLDGRALTPGHRDTTSVGIGAFVYWGAEVVPATMTVPRFTNNLGRVGGDLRLRMPFVDLIGQVVLGRDDNVDAMSTRVQHVAWSAEADFVAFPWLQPYARFEEAYFDVRPDHRRLVLGAAFFIRTNLRVVVEGVAGLRDRGTMNGDADQVVGELMFAI